MASFEGKVIAITGGASGIGLSIAQLLHSRGATLSLADIDAGALSAAFNTLGASADKVLTTQLDVGSAPAVNAWIAATVAKFGRLDGAANMAGVIGKHHGTRGVDELDDEQWELIIRVNLTGMMYSMRAELRAMSEGGSIVNAASIQGLQGFARHGAYVASKHGVVGLTRTAAKEFGGRVRVNAVAPGAIETPLLHKSFAMTGPMAEYESAIKRLGTAEEVANLAVFLLSDEASYVTGQIVSVDGGWNC